MAKGKYAKRAENRQLSTLTDLITELETTVTDQRDEIERLRKQEKRIEPLERALAHAKEEADAVTSPQIRHLEADNANLQRIVDEVERTKPHRDALWNIAMELFQQHEGMTGLEAQEEIVKRSGIDATLVEGDVQKRFSPEIVKRIQRSRGLRR